MGLRLEVMTKGAIDAVSEGLIPRPIRVYNINDDSLTAGEIEAVKNLLADPVVDIFGSPVLAELPHETTVIEMSPKPGVNDPEGKETKRAIENILGREIGDISFAKQFLYKGQLAEEEYEKLKKQIGNPLINEFIQINYQNWNPKVGVGFHFPKVELPVIKPFEYINIWTTDESLMRLSEDRKLALNLEEMKTIVNGFRNEESSKTRKGMGLQSLPTDAELEALAQTWSEHCIHKKFNGKWIYTSEDLNDESGLPHVTDSIFKSIIKKTTYDIMNNIDWVVSVFDDNSGVIKLNDRNNLAHKVETHNFPSTLDPFGGANTGIGGDIRDNKSTGTGSRPCTDQFAFRVPHPNSYTDLPPDILSPAKILQGIVSGVEDYGNKMGIPTMCGNVLIDDGWLKCGVYVGCVSVVPAEINGKLTHTKEIKPGYIGLSLGGKVGKDGIHGATVSSTSQSSNAEKDFQVNQAVQIGDPITEKGVFEVMEILQALGYIEATQDCGAGGWNSAIGELSQLSNGAVMDLTHVPEKYKGLTGWEKLISEAQEREIVVIKPENLARVLEICRHNNVEATNFAVFNDSGYYHVLDQNQTIVYLPVEFMHRGLPQMTIKAHYKPCENKEPELPNLENITGTLHKLVSAPNMQIYDWIITRYDHEVQGGSLIKPIVGIGRGKSDAVAYHPILGEKEVVIETIGSNPWQGDIDAYHMGKNNVVDAIGKIIAAGGSLEKIVFNGNTTCAKPEEDENVAAQVMRMLKGAADAEIAFGAPTISGKDSTSMERKYKSTVTGKEVNVKAKSELLMSGLGVIKDDSTLTTCDFKLPGDLIYVVGETKDELGASEYYLLHNETGRNVPKSDLMEIKSRYLAVENVIKSGLVHSAQYLSKGGLAFAIANSAIAGDLGVDISLDMTDDGLGKADKLLFSETTGRFIVTVHGSKQKEFEEKMRGHYVKPIGVVRHDKNFSVEYKCNSIVSTDVDILREKNKGEIRF